MSGAREGRSPEALVLGIESSCDEMAAAVVEAGRRIRSSVIHSQTDVHAPYGGVVPELASRDHVRSISGVVGEALRLAAVDETELSGIAVTRGPGLVGSLLVGLSFGKALALRLGIPVVGVHHLAGHLASAELAEPGLAPPYIGLVVSGGHTALYRLEAESPPTLLGETRDDAVGEAFDKVAKLLGLPYPGGPAVSDAARSGDPASIALPRPLEGFQASSSPTAGSRPRSPWPWRGGGLFARRTSPTSPRPSKRPLPTCWWRAHAGPSRRRAWPSWSSWAGWPRTGACAHAWPRRPARTASAWSSRRRSSVPTTRP